MGRGRVTPSAISTRAAIAWRNAFRPNADSSRATGSAVYLANRIELIDIYLACVKLGVIFVPINILYREREMSHILSDAEPKRLIDRSRASRAWRRMPPAAECLEAVRAGGRCARGAGLYLGNHGNVSKGAILTHNNFAANAVNLIGLLADHRSRPLPAGAAVVSRACAGQRAALLAGHRDAACGCSNDSSIERPPGHFWTSSRRCSSACRPSMCACWTRPLETAHEIGKKMRLFVSGSAPLPAQVLEEFREKFGHTILERYGMTRNADEYLESVRGRAASGQRRVSAARRFGLDQMRTGELHLKGPNVFAGYWRREEATRDAFVDGWFKTGDIATRSADGYYTLCGRRSDLIISGGFNIYPREIEEFLGEQPEIAKRRW